LTNPVDSKYGPIQVYRELKPLQEEVEFTVFFRKDGTKWRTDFTVHTEDFAELPPEAEAEDYVLGVFYAEVEAGNYKDARYAIDDASNNGK
jgi:hypothetical protein